jgi:signal transduction histidine kinase
MVQRELHDHVGSSLAGMTMTIDMALRSLTTDSVEAKRVLTDLRADVMSLIDHVRQLLTGNPLPHRGNVTLALRRMLGGMGRAVADRMTISLTLDPLLGSVPEDVAWAAFSIVREAMTNVLKHSCAQHCAVTLSLLPDELTVRVQDDGVGMHQVRRAGGTGLANMRSRAAEQGGWCAIEPMAPTGVAVTAWFPLSGRGEVT